jgi:hypothetical protein
MDVSYRDQLTGKSGSLTLLFGPTEFAPENTNNDAVVPSEPFLQVRRGLKDGDELGLSDVVQIETAVRDANIPLPASLLAAREALVPACDSPAAFAALVAHSDALTDPFLGQHPALRALSAVSQESFDALGATRACDATAELNIGQRLIAYQFTIRDGVLNTHAVQVWKQDRNPPEPNAGGTKGTTNEAVANSVG